MSTSIQNISSLTSNKPHHSSQSITSIVVNSQSLLQGKNFVNIQHNGEVYQLRATRLGKLILTK